MNELQATNWIDGVVYLIMLVSVSFGAWRGLFSSLFGIIGLVLAIHTAWSFGGKLEPSLHPLLGDSLITPVAATALLFLIAFSLFGLIAKMFVAAAKKVDVGGFNFFGGALFGFLRGGLFALIFVLLMSAIGVQESKPWAHAKTVPVLGGVLKQSLAIPAFAPYQSWLQFDGKDRPVLVDGRKKVAKKKKKKKSRHNILSTPEEEAAAEAAAAEALREETEEISSVTLDKARRRDEELDEVLDELAEYTAVKSAYSPHKDNTHHESDMRALGKELTCMLFEDEEQCVAEAEASRKADESDMRALGKELTCMLFEDEEQCVAEAEASRKADGAPSLGQELAQSLKCMLVAEGEECE